MYSENTLRIVKFLAEVDQYLDNDFGLNDYGLESQKLLSNMIQVLEAVSTLYVESSLSWMKLLDTKGWFKNEVLPAYDLPIYVLCLEQPRGRIRVEKAHYRRIGYVMEYTDSKPLKKDAYIGLGGKPIENNQTDILGWIPVENTH